MSGEQVNYICQVISYITGILLCQVLSYIIGILLCQVIRYIALAGLLENVYTARAWGRYGCTLMMKS